MSNSLDPDQDRHFVGPDLDPNCLQRLSTDYTLEGKELTLLIWVQTVCKDYQQITKVAASKERFNGGHSIDGEKSYINNHLISKHR